MPTKSEHTSWWGEPSLPPPLRSKSMRTILAVCLAVLCANESSVAQTHFLVKYRATNNALAEYFRKMRAFSKNENSVLFSDENLEKERMMGLTTDGRRSQYAELEDEGELTDDDSPRIRYVSQDYWGERCNIYKEYATGAVIMEQYFNGRPHLLTDSSFTRKWDIREERTVMMGMQCQKAVSADTITAWFAVDVPIPDGPHTYGGLPGLIIRLDDSHEQYECISMESTDEKIPDTPRRGKRMSMAEFRAYVEDDFSHMGERLGYE